MKIPLKSSWTNETEVPGGKQCKVRHKVVYFAAQCSGNRKPPVNKVDDREDSSDGSEYDQIKIVKNESKQGAKQSTVSHFPKRLYAAINVGNQPVSIRQWSDM